MKDRIQVGSRIQIPNLYITDIVKNITILIHDQKVGVEVETQKGHWIHPEMVRLIEVVDQY